MNPQNQRTESISLTKILVTNLFLLTLLSLCRHCNDSRSPVTHEIGAEYYTRDPMTGTQIVDAIKTFVCKNVNSIPQQKNLLQRLASDGASGKIALVMNSFWIRDT